MLCDFCYGGKDNRCAIELYGYDVLLVYAAMGLCCKVMARGRSTRWCITVYFAGGRTMMLMGIVGGDERAGAV